MYLQPVCKKRIPGVTCHHPLAYGVRGLAWQTCSRLLACEALPWRCSFDGGRSPGICPAELAAAPERARCRSIASIVSPVWTVPPEKLGAVCSGPVRSRHAHSAHHHLPLFPLQDSISNRSDVY